MTITNDERRQVAARLRECAPTYNYKGGHPDMMSSLVAITGTSIDSLFDRLADIIEPEPERTCHIDNEHAFGCAINGAIYITRFSCGHFMENSVLKNEINFCPTCGAKVLDD